MLYSDLVTGLCTELVLPPTDPNFVAILPRIIDDAEGRIYRDLDFLETRTSLLSASALQNQRAVMVPSTIIVLESINVLSALQPITTNNLQYDTPFTASAGTTLYNIRDINPKPTLQTGDWVNIPSAVQQNNAGIIQGPYQIQVANTYYPYSLITSLTAGTAGSFAGATFVYQTTAASNVITTYLFNNVTFFNQYYVGACFTVANPTSVGGIVLSGTYTITSTSSGQFTFLAAAPAVFTDSQAENDAAAQIQYLGTFPQGQKTTLERLSKDALDQAWPSANGQQGVPKYYTLLNTVTALVAPTPAQNLLLEFTGTIRPQQISAINTSTYLSITYPDLFFAACMVYGFLYQRDAGEASQISTSVNKWETVYQDRKQNVMGEAQRQKGQGTNWSPYSSTPESKPRP